MKKAVIGNCTLYCADNRVIYDDLGMVDHIITDPPYEVEAHTKGRRNSRNGVKSTPLSFDPITEEQRATLCTAARCTCKGWLFLFCQVEAIGTWAQAVRNAGLKWRRGTVWIKPDGMPRFSGDGPAQGCEGFAIAWCGPGNSWWNGRGKAFIPVLSHQDNQAKIFTDHQTVKPLRLMAKIIADFTRPGDMVLDPFMGSGSTGVACAKMGRKFIGIEKDERSFNQAVARIKDIYTQGSLVIQPCVSQQLSLV